MADPLLASAHSSQAARTEVENPLETILDLLFQ